MQDLSDACRFDRVPGTVRQVGQLCEPLADFSSLRSGRKAAGRKFLGDFKQQRSRQLSACLGVGDRLAEHFHQVQQAVAQDLRDQLVLHAELRQGVLIVHQVGDQKYASVASDLLQHTPNPFCSRDRSLNAPRTASKSSR